MRCEGPTFLSAATIIKWPHTLVIDCPGKPILDVPDSFLWREKRFVLRGFVLNGGNHFTALLRTPVGWMHYDGIGWPKFQFFQKQHARQATKGRLLALAFFEVVPETEGRYFATATDWARVFESGEFSTEAKAQVEEEDLMSEDELDLQNLDVRMGTFIRKNKRQKPKQEPAVKKRSPAKRLPMGWCCKEAGGIRGSLAICKGCGSEIERAAARLAHTTAAPSGRKHKSKSHFHCKAACIRKGCTGAVLDSMLQKKWTQSLVCSVVKEIQEGQR